MKKVFFFTNSVDLANPSDGLAKKIHAQVKAFEELGYDVHLAGMKKDQYFINDQFIVISENSVFAKNRQILNFLKSYIEANADFDVFYIRKSYFTYTFISFLSAIRKKIRFIVLEIPTYPYYGELHTLRAKVGYWIEALTVTYRLKKYIDWIVTFSDDKKIFCIDTIRISNGIDPNEIEVFKDLSKEDKINFISVSSISYWHGIDRFIKSMESVENIHFYIIGPSNDESNKLKKIVLEKKLQNKVSFCGYMSKDELSKIYQISHIGVGSLGRHRSGILALNSLKNREYLAKGLPVIYSEIDSDLDHLDFVYKVSADEDLIDIEEIINWYLIDTISREKIVKFSKKFLWKVQIKLILDKLGF